MIYFSSNKQVAIATRDKGTSYVVSVLPRIFKIQIFILDFEIKYLQIILYFSHK